MFEIITYLIVLITLLIGTYTDFKMREVPDWLSYSLILTGICIRIIFSIIYTSPSYILHGLFGFTAMFIIAL